MFPARPSIPEAGNTDVDETLCIDPRLNHRLQQYQPLRGAVLKAHESLLTITSYSPQ